MKKLKLCLRYGSTKYLVWKNKKFDRKSNIEAQEKNVEKIIYIYKTIWDRHMLIYIFLWQFLWCLLHFVGIMISPCGCWVGTQPEGSIIYELMGSIKCASHVILEALYPQRKVLCRLHQDIDGLGQERRNSSALAMELRLYCTNPHRWVSARKM